MQTPDFNARMACSFKYLKKRVGRLIKALHQANAMANSDFETSQEAARLLRSALVSFEEQCEGLKNAAACLIERLDSELGNKKSPSDGNQKSHAALKSGIPIKKSFKF